MRINYSFLINLKNTQYLYFVFFLLQLFIDPNKLLPLARFLPRPPGSKPSGGGRGGRGGGGGRGTIFYTGKIL